MADATPKAIEENGPANHRLKLEERITGSHAVS